jgi:hypothetical protein
MRIVRFGFTPAERRFARGRVELIFPDQFVGEGKSVASEIKPSGNMPIPASLRRGALVLVFCNFHNNRAWKEVKAALTN